MNTLREAAQQALEALESALRYHGVVLLSAPPQDAWKFHGVEATANAAIAAVRQAIEAEQQAEPFGYFRPEPFGWTDCAKTDESAIALYERSQPPVAALSQWVGLTDKEVALMGAPWHLNLLTGKDCADLVAYTRAVEAKLREKNTSPQPKQQPLTKQRIDELIEEGVFGSNPYELVRRLEEERGVVMTRPLTEEQISAVVREAAKGSYIQRDGGTSHRIARAIERAHGIGQEGGAA